MLNIRRLTPILDSLTSPQVLVSIGILAAWQIISLFFPNAIFPDVPHLVENVITVLTGTGRYQPQDHIPITLLRISLGFSIAMILGSFIGLLMGIYLYAERYLLSVVLALLSFPSVVWAFLAVSWFGLTDLLVPVFVVTLIVVPYVIINIWEGTKSINHDLVEMGHTFGAGDAKLWRDVYLPQIKPHTYATFRIAFALSWKIVLVAEIFGTGRGVGFVINESFLRLQADMVIAWALPVMVIIYVLDRVLKELEDRSFAWRPSLETEYTGGVSE